MRKTNLMLIAALVASPFALAETTSYDPGYDYGYGYDVDDVTIDGSGNLYYDKNVELNVEKSKYISNVGNSDNDKLILGGVGNKYYKSIEDNSTHDWSVDVDLDKELNYYLAESKLHGYVMDNTVTYGGACCKSGSSGDFKVIHENNMGGSFVDASGINVAAQNVGNNSMVQQATSTNAHLVSMDMGDVGSGMEGSY